MEKLIYLDNAATTYPKPEIVYNAMDKFLREECVNSGRGSYKLSKKATKVIEETRDLLLELVNSHNGKVIFSPSATIATNQILRGLEWKNIKNVYVSPFEHNAIMRTLHSIQKENEFEINIIKFDNITFQLDEDDLRLSFVKKKPDLIIMSHISNVTGYVLPIKKCHELAESYNPINIVDCAQSLGLIDIDAQKDFSKSHFIIFAGHKSLYGPLGIGGFIQLNNDIKLKPILTGGTGSDSTNLEMPKEFEHMYEPGSYNTYAIKGLNVALKWIKEVGINNIYKHKKHLSNLLIEEIEKIDEIEIYVPENLENHIGVISFNLEGYKASEIGKILDEDFNICVRTGHHCAPYIGKFLEGMAQEGTVRVSLSYFNTEEDIEGFINAINDIT